MTRFTTNFVTSIKKFASLVNEIHTIHTILPDYNALMSHKEHKEFGQNFYWFSTPLPLSNLPPTLVKFNKVHLFILYEKWILRNR